MSNLSDKDIDRLSRDAADLYEPDPSSLSWSRLEQKLIEQIPERPPDGFRFNRMNPLVWGSAVIIIAGLSVFTIKNFNYSQHSTRSNQKILKGITTHPADDSNLENNSGKTNSVAKVVTGVSVNTNAQTRAKDPSTNDQEKISDEKSNNNRVSNNQSKIKSNLNAAGQAFFAGGGINSRSPGNTQTREDKNINGNSNSGSVTSNSTTAGLSSYNESNQIENSRGISTRYTLPVIVTKYHTPETMKGNDSILIVPNHPVAVLHKSLRLNRSLNFGLSFGPDYTDAGGITNNQLGNNIGITIGYYLTSKFSLNTGIFYSNKFFWAPGQKTGISNRSNQPWTAAAAPLIDYINGAANIWEIPFTLRYDFAQSEKTKFFVNAGLSSYFIMKQTYINFFYSGQRLLAYKTYDDQQLNYWFKVADISFGFETDLGKGFSFQAEPFFKLPLTTMGVENLKLNSYGFLLSFRYSPVLSRTKK
jgi:hypothetical protein